MPRRRFPGIARRTGKTGRSPVRRFPNPDCSFQNVTTSAPRKQQSGNAISAQTWRSLELWLILKREDWGMSNIDHTKSGGKSGQRKRKREQQGSQRLERPQSAMPEQLPDAREPSEAAVASTDTSSMIDAATSDAS